MVVNEHEAANSERPRKSAASPQAINAL